MLLQNDPRFKLVPSLVTRPMRPWEVQWNPYFFISHEEFQEKIEEGEFLEYAFVHNTYYYGTSKTILKEVVSQWYIPFKEFETQWLEQLRKTNCEFSYKSIFFTLEESEIIKRISARAPISKEEIHNRIESTKKELVVAHKFVDCICDANDTVENNFRKLQDFIEKHY